MEISIELLSEIDLKDLFNFELANRAYFEEMVPGRGGDYFHYETFLKRNMELLKEQHNNQCYFYLIKNSDKEILGRINIVDIHPSEKVGHIGYRIGVSHIGKGVASKALALIMKQIEELNISKLLAKTTINNIGSQRVLEKNNFKHVSTEQESFEMNGQQVSFIHYEWCK